MEILDNKLYNYYLAYQIIDWDIEFSSSVDGKNEKYLLLNQIDKNIEYLLRQIQNEIRHNRSVCHIDDVFKDEINKRVSNLEVLTDDKEYYDVLDKLEKAFNSMDSSNRAILDTINKIKSLIKLRLNRMSISSGENKYFKFLSTIYSDLDLDLLFSNMKKLITLNKKIDYKIRKCNYLDNHIDININKIVSKKILKLFDLDKKVKIIDYKFNSLSLVGNNDIRLTLDFNKNINFFMRQIFHELGHAKYQATIKPIKYKILEIPNSLIDDETVGILFEKFILYNPIIKNQLENFLELEIDLFSQFDPSKRIYSQPIKDDIFNILYVLIEEDLFSNKSITTIKEDFDDRIQELNLDINNINIYADPHWFYGDFGYYIAYIEAKFRAADIYNNLIKIGIKDTNSLKENIEFCFSSIRKYLELGKNVNGNIIQYLLSRNTDYNEYFKWLDENKNIYSQ